MLCKWETVAHYSHSWDGKIVELLLCIAYTVMRKTTAQKIRVIHKTLQEVWQCRLGSKVWKNRQFSQLQVGSLPPTNKYTQKKGSNLKSKHAVHLTA